MNDRTKAALIGGLVAGVLSGIPYIGGCCFIWALGGGFLAIFMILRGATGPMEMADGAKVGAITGAIALVPFVILRVLWMLLGVGIAAASYQGAGDNTAAIAGITAVAGIGGIVIGAIVVVVCAVLGGVIGVAALGKRAGAPPPPPPPAAGGYGGPGM